jgi:hypothetical protein
VTVTTAAGTTFALSASAPVSLDDAGYEALTYTEVGEVGDLGDIPSLIYEIVSWRAIDRRGESKAKGGFSYPPQTIMVGLDPQDVGQALLTTATAQDGFYTVRISHPLIGSFYGQALVMGGPTSFGDGSSIATRSVTLEYVEVLYVASGPGIPSTALSLDGSALLALSLDGSVARVLTLA